MIRKLLFAALIITGFHTHTTSKNNPYMQTANNLANIYIETFKGLSKSDKDIAQEYISHLYNMTKLNITKQIKPLIDNFSRESAIKSSEEYLEKLKPLLDKWTIVFTKVNNLDTESQQLFYSQLKKIDHEANKLISVYSDIYIKAQLNTTPVNEGLVTIGGPPLTDEEIAALKGKLTHLQEAYVHILEQLKRYKKHF